jgi:hypothetical protein
MFIYLRKISCGKKRKNLPIEAKANVECGFLIEKLKIDSLSELASLANQSGSRMACFLPC